jgi:hypothetical protein
MIDQFQGQFRWLSNFGEGSVHLDGIWYPTAEHAYQASKSELVEFKHVVAALASPGAAKRAGRQLVDIRPDWEQVKKRVMVLVVLAKFIQNPELARRLVVETGGHQLVEGNHWHDNFWGNCVCDRCSEVPGANWLGRILEFVRDVVAPD